MVNYTPHHSGYIYVRVNKKIRVTWNSCANVST
jgi:hypothetical protein